MSEPVREVMPEYAAEQALAFQKEANPAPVFTDAQLAEINSWDDLDKALKGRDDVITADISEYGTGYAVLDNKDRLVDVPFIITSYRFNLGDKGVFVSLGALTKSGEKWIVNDGSTGIKDQLLAITDKHKGVHPVIRVNRGLHKSTYNPKNTDGSPMLNKDGSEMNATTYYLKMDAAQ